MNQHSPAALKYGRRTGQGNIIQAKQIRRLSDGGENYHDYWSDTSRDSTIYEPKKKSSTHQPLRAGSRKSHPCKRINFENKSIACSVSGYLSGSIDNAEVVKCSAGETSNSQKKIVSNTKFSKNATDLTKFTPQNSAEKIGHPKNIGDSAQTTRRNKSKLFSNENKSVCKNVKNSIVSFSTEESTSKPLAKGSSKTPKPTSKVHRDANTSDIPRKSFQTIAISPVDANLSKASRNCTNSISNSVPKTSLQTLNKVQFSTPSNKNVIASSKSTSKNVNSADNENISSKSQNVLYKDLSHIQRTERESPVSIDHCSSYANTCHRRSPRKHNSDRGEINLNYKPNVSSHSLHVLEKSQSDSNIRVSSSHLKAKSSLSESNINLSVRRSPRKSFHRESQVATLNSSKIQVSSNSGKKSFATEKNKKHTNNKSFSTKGDRTKNKFSVLHDLLDKCKSVSKAEYSGSHCNQNYVMCGNSGSISTLNEKSLDIDRNPELSSSVKKNKKSLAKKVLSFTHVPEETINKKTSGGNLTVLDSSFHSLQTEASQSDQELSDANSIRTQSVRKKNNISNQTLLRTSAVNSNDDDYDRFTKKLGASKIKKTQISKKILNSTALPEKGEYFQKPQVFAPEFTFSPIVLVDKMKKQAVQHFVNNSESDADNSSGSRPLINSRTKRKSKLLIGTEQCVETSESELDGFVRSDKKSKLSKMQKSQKNVFTKIKGRKAMVIQSDGSSCDKSDLDNGSLCDETLNVNNIGVTNNEIAHSKENSSYWKRKKAVKIAGSNVAHSSQKVLEQRVQTSVSELGGSIRSDEKAKLSKTQKSQKKVLAKIKGRKAVTIQNDGSRSEKSDLDNGSFYGETLNVNNIEDTNNEIAPLKENSAHRIGVKMDKTTGSNVADFYQKKKCHENFVPSENVPYVDAELYTKKSSKEDINQNTQSKSIIGFRPEAVSDTNGNQIEFLPNENWEDSVSENNSVYSVGMESDPSNSHSGYNADGNEYNSHIVATAKRNNLKKVNDDEFVNVLPIQLSEASSSAQNRSKHVNQDISMNLDRNESVPIANKTKPKKNKKVGSKASGNKTHKSSMENIPENVRRSHRTRIPPLDQWRNERPKYCFNDDGNLTLIGFDEGMKNQCYEPAATRTAAEKQRPDKQKAKKRKHSLEKPCIVLDLSTNEEVSAHIIKPFESLTWILGDNDSNQTNDYRITKSFETEKMVFGFIEIKISKAKGMQLLPVTDVHFCVLQGKVKVTAYKSTFFANELTSFVVPQGNPYKIANVGKKNAIISFSLCDGSVLKRLALSEY